MPKKTTKQELIISTGAVPQDIRMDSIKTVVQNDEQISNFYRRKLLKQQFQAVYVQRQEQIRMALEADKKKLAALSRVAERQINKEEETLTLQIRREYIQTMADLGHKVEKAQLEFLTDFAEDLEGFRRRLAKRDLNPTEKKMILDLSKKAFQRVYDKLGDLTADIIEAANSKEIAT